MQSIETEPSDPIVESVSDQLTRGEFVLKFLDALDAAGIDYVFLRNYEEVPASVGHDVDILVAPGRRPDSIGALREVAREHRWMYLGYAEFSPLAAFVANPDGSEVLHIDLFDRVEHYWCEFADTPRILSRRVHTGLVYRPHVIDEVFVSLCTRWIYISVVREKHREQLAKAIEEEGEESVRAAFFEHLGKRAGSKVFEIAANAQWDRIDATVSTLRRGSRVQHGLKRPLSALRGLCRYFGRTLRRLLRPPAPFVVVLGADGVGKSTAIEGIVPLLEDITGISDPLHFHWKPCRKSIRRHGTEAPPAHDPRAKQSRGRISSLVFLAYHWLGFWVGWFRWIYPQVVRNRSVIGDRYAIDMCLDPQRFRLNAPNWLLRLASRTVPQPDLVLALHADPETVIQRKAELSEAEIASYQDRILRIAERHRNVVPVDAGRSVENVRIDLRMKILRWAQTRAGHTPENGQ